MTIAQVGYFGLTGAVFAASTWTQNVFAASTLTQNIGIAVGVVTLLVLISTLLIRFTSTVEKVTKSVIYRMQADGDLSTRREEEALQETLKALEQKVDRLLDSDGQP